MPLLAPLVWRRGLSRHWPKVLARLERIPPPAPQATQHRDSLNGIGLYRANVLSRLLKPRTRKAIAPVQLLIAKHDPFVTAALLRGLEPHTPQLQRVELPCGHWSPLSHPQLLVEHIHHFAQQIDLSAEAV